MKKYIRFLKKIKINSITLCFIPILVFLPLGYELILNIHFGGKELFFEFIKAAFNPKIDHEIIKISFLRISETFFIAIISWSISILFGVIFGILSSNIFYKIFKIPIIIKYFFKNLLILLRSFHELLWGLILIQIYGSNLSLGIVSICLAFTGVNAKVISDSLDLIESKNIESILQINGNKFSNLITLIWVPLKNILNNFGSYRLECAFRSTVILGLCGIGGIGNSIFLSFQTLNFRELWTYIWILFLAIFISNKLISKLNAIKFNINFFFTIFFTISLLILTKIFFINFLINGNLISDLSINIFSIFENQYISNNLLNLIFETLILIIFSSAISISLPPLLLLISNNLFTRYILNLIAFFFRIIPPPILVLILLIFNQPSISLASLVLGLHNGAITYKLLNNSLNNQIKDNFYAIKSLGASKRVSWLYGSFAQQAKSYLGYCAYRADILIRESAIVGIAGSIGLGWQLKESLSSFAWNEVVIIIIIYALIAIFGELINDKIKRNFT